MYIDVVSLVVRAIKKASGVFAAVYAAKWIVQSSMTAWHVILPVLWLSVLTVCSALVVKVRWHSDRRSIRIRWFTLQS